MAKWDQHPDRDEEWATEEMSRIGEERFRREHECEFIIYNETLIDALYLANMTHTETCIKQDKYVGIKDPQQTKCMC